MRFGRWLMLAVVSASAGLAGAQERLPAQVSGTWRITRVLPVRAAGACWTEKEAQPLVGSLLRYGQSSMRWQGGVVPLLGVTTRTVTPEEFARENGGDEAAMGLPDLGIRTRSGVTEVNMQHEDADVTGATTEIPGDSVLVAGADRIVVSACGVYMEARRVPAKSQPSGTQTTTSASNSSGLSRRGM